MESYTWYAQLLKPAWAPPAWLFGPVWTVLYTVIAVTFGYVFWLIRKGKLPVSLLVPFVLNIVTNLLFTPLQFGLRSNVLAMFDIIAVLVTLGWSLVAVYPNVRWVAIANLPYLAWVAFATVLQITITLLNA